MKNYNFQEIEKKWQKIWQEEKVFEVTEDPSKPKYYCLEMFPYPSGDIHMGHIRNYLIGDVIARFKKMKGFNVLHPIGWDALGLPAENAAIKHNLHPEKWTLDNINHMRKQLKRIGFSYAWQREVNTCLPEYYRWNQWLFLKMYEKGLAYRKKSWVNWCPTCITVLANEQVIAGKCWRCESEVRQKELEQWFLKITDYAEELLSGHEELKEWPERVLIMQKNWIGKSYGATINFPIVGSSKSIEVFTTRIDTIFGATFLVLSPEHPTVKELTANSLKEKEFLNWINKTIIQTKAKREIEEIEREGIFTGKKALNPFSQEEIPIWIANYVLMEYGTGAIMAVPAHDQRDFEFAQKYKIPIKIVIQPEKNKLKEPLAQAFEDYGILVNSGKFSGLSSEEAIKKMAQWAKGNGIGNETITYRLRDWGISRQRYWGTPIPIIYCEKCGIVPVPYEQLPVELPKKVELKGEEGSPLAKVKSFVNTNCPNCDAKAKRETDTMDTFFDSSWYNYRYTSPKEKNLPFNPEVAQYWMPVDIYIGGIEHAIMHLIYARFFAKVIRDLEISHINEPFPKLLSQGMVTKDGSAMSKSKGNVVDPDEFIEKYGADTLRLFILSASPPEKDLEWSDKGAEGSFRFLNRIWRVINENLDLFEKDFIYPTNKLTHSQKKLQRKVHQTIKKVTEDIEERFHLNTAISAIRELYNTICEIKEELRKNDNGQAILRESLETIILLLSPFTSHICEELWQMTNHRNSLNYSSWPSYQSELAKEELVTIVIQVNGKLRGKFEASLDISDEEVKEKALSNERVQPYIKDKEIRKVIYIKNKLVNIVV
ncbi:MAG: leucine--tRNA ligase [Candidatus Aminicenantia bacterium]